MGATDCEAQSSLVRGLQRYIAKTMKLALLSLLIVGSCAIPDDRPNPDEHPHLMRMVVNMFWAKLENESGSNDVPDDKWWSMVTNKWDTAPQNQLLGWDPEFEIFFDDFLVRRRTPSPCLHNSTKTVTRTSLRTSGRRGLKSY